MKRLETPSKTEKRAADVRVAHTVAILCFIYAGVSLMLLIYQGYNIYLHDQAPPGGRELVPFETFLAQANGTNMTLPIPPNALTRETYEEAVRGRLRTGLLMPLAINVLGIMLSVIAGSVLLRIVRRREHVELKRDVIAAMVLPDEQRVIDELTAAGGDLMQSEIVLRTALTKVKVHRVVKRLETLGIVKKYPYGMTNKIKLEKDLLDE